MNSLRLNSVLISNLSSVKGGLIANNNNQQPINAAPSTAGPSLDCGYSAGCHTYTCKK
ncbi:hypothetical protein H2O64_06085 [Kordia sp. YSTF-M3]|uniref:Bacteriocin n=1 Tax=Kordia aestuariivivens TaxID=2759037 RepID=A0ABR7Q6R7_9FLAO|nr:hypothetical protein [Kordia aestuariivivens]MBC8754233.1 hypothetical protein [Kordia aestuariivivens]